MPSFRFHRPNVSPSRLLGYSSITRFHLRTRVPSVARYSVAAEAAFEPALHDIWVPFKEKPFEDAKPDPTQWEQYNKNRLAGLLGARAPHLDYRPYLAASHVFPIRMNPYVIDNMIDWYDLFLSLFSLWIKNESLHIHHLTFACSTLDLLTPT